MGKKNDFHPSFLTWNIYLGADLVPLLPGPTPAAVTQVFLQFLATDFPVRAKAIARAIASKKPDIHQFARSSTDGVENTNVRNVAYDFVEILLTGIKRERIAL